MPNNAIDIARIHECHAKGMNITHTAHATGYDRTTVRKYWPKDGKAESPEIKLAAAEMQAAAERYDDSEFEDPARIWKRIERESDYKIRKAAEACQFTWKSPSRHVLITFVSDQHIAPGTPVDHKQMRIDAELVANTPNCYAIMGGDGVDNHVKHRAAIISARSTPTDQYKLFEYYLQIFGNKCLLAVSGNHDNWTAQFAGVDAMARIFKDNRVFYNPDEAYLDMQVGSQNYVIGVRHQYRYNSSFNQTHSVKQWLRLGMREFDIGCIGHHHEHAIESFVYRGKLCWGCRPGAYQQTTAYSRQYGYNPSLPTCPTFLLRGDTREIHGFQSLAAAIDAMKAMREIS